MITYGEQLFDSIDYIGDQSDRVRYQNMKPANGKTVLLRYAPSAGRRGKLNGIFAGYGYPGMVAYQAYLGATSGATIRLNLGSTTRMEQRVQWCGLSGYIGGADDSDCEASMAFHVYGQPVTAASAITAYVTPALATRPVIVDFTIYGMLSSGAGVREKVRQFIQSTTETAVLVYTVPAATTLALQFLTARVSVADGTLGKGNISYGNNQVASFELIQTDFGAVYGFSIPIMGADIPENMSLTFNVDAFNCMNETMNATFVVNEEAVARYPIFGGGHVIGKTGRN